MYKRYSELCERQKRRIRNFQASFPRTPLLVPSSSASSSSSEGASSSSICEYQPVQAWNQRNEQNQEYNPDEYPCVPIHSNLGLKPNGIGIPNTAREYTSFEYSYLIKVRLQSGLAWSQG